MLEGVFIDEAIEVPFEFTGHFGWSTGARTVDEALRALVRKAMDPLAQGRIRKLEGVGNSLEALPFDDIAHGLCTAKDAGLLRLLQKGVQGGQGIIRKMEFEGTHEGRLHNKVLQKYENSSLDIVQLPSDRNKVFSTQISQELLMYAMLTPRDTTLACATWQRGYVSPPQGCLRRHAFPRGGCAWTRSLFTASPPLTSQRW